MIFFWKQKLFKSINLKNIDEFTIIMNQYGDKIINLIEKGKLKNVLYESIRCESESINNFLIKSHYLPKLINAFEFPIFRAIMNDDVNLVNELLNLGANPNLTKSFTFVSSYFCKSKKMYEYILSKNIFIVSNWSLVRYGATSDILLVKNKLDERESPLYYSISSNKLYFTIEFIKFPECINKIDKIHSEVPLFAACNQENIEHLKCLIKANVDFNVFNEEGCKPLHVTCKNGFIEHTKLLLENGCSLYDLNKGDSTPYNVACWSGHKEIKIFLDEYIKVHMPDNPPERDY